MNKDKQKSDEKTDRKEMPFLDHLEEFRWRILKSLGSVFVVTVVTFPFTGFLLNLLTLPNDKLSEPAELIFLKPTGMLVVRMEVALVVGIIVSLPVLFYQFWQFVAPGLLPNERKYVIPALLFTTFCFLLGTSFAYFILIPTVLPFLFSRGTDTIAAKININEYMSFALRLIIVAGAIFELPVLAFFLSRIGIVTPKFLRKYRTYGVVIVFIFSAVVTPPDPASQMLMDLRLLLLYQIRVRISVIGERKKKASDKAREEALDLDDDPDPKEKTKTEEKKK